MFVWMNSFEGQFCKFIPDRLMQNIEFRIHIPYYKFKFTWIFFIRHLHETQDAVSSQHDSLKKKKCVIMEYGCMYDVLCSVHSKCCRKVFFLFSFCSLLRSSAHLMYRVQWFSLFLYKSISCANTIAPCFLFILFSFMCTIFCCNK